MKLLRNSCDGIYSSLDVRFTSSCDNRCSFCIEKNGIDPLASAPVEEMISATLASGIKDVLILGGEPMLFPDRVLAYVKGIRSKVDHIWLTTSVPSTVWTHTKTWNEIISLLDGLNVSVQDATSEENNNFKFVAQRPHNRLEALELLTENHADKIRVSIFLSKANISTPEQLDNSLMALAMHGVKHVKLSELQSCPELYVSYEKMMGVKLPAAFAFGCFTDLKSLGKKYGMKIQLKRSCFMVEPSQTANMFDMIKAIVRPYLQRYSPTHTFRVLYENARLATKWEKKGE